jgi:hypothetical protein
MSSEHMIKFEMEDLLAAIEKLGEVRSTDDNMERLPKSPVHALVYNQILQFSIEELEGPVKERNRTYSFPDIMFQHRHAFFFTACVRRGAFRNILSKETKILLDNLPNTSNALFESIHIIEKSRMSKGTANAEPLDFSIFIDTLMSRYFYSFKDEEKKVVMDLIIDKFGVKESKSFLNYVVKNMGSYSSTACEYVVERLKELNLDLSTANLNCHLPKEKPIYKPFDIGNFERPKIEKLLKMGFRFDEKNYSYNGTNLFITVARSEDFKLCEMILPYLSDITPFNGDLDQQNKFIEYLPKIYPDNYRFIQTHYERLILNLELNQKPESAEKVRKPKI